MRLCLKHSMAAVFRAAFKHLNPSPLLVPVQGIFGNPATCNAFRL